MLLETVNKHTAEFWDIVNYYQSDEWPAWVKEVVDAIKEKREPVGVLPYAMNVYSCIVDSEEVKALLNI